MYLKQELLIQQKVKNMCKSEQQSRGTATSGFKIFGLIYLSCHFFKKMRSPSVFYSFVMELVDVVSEAKKKHFDINIFFASC